MLAREFRIAADKDIKRVLKLGKRFSCPECSLYVSGNTLGRPRVCVIVAGGVSKLAVVRNRVKRQARDVLRVAVERGAMNGALDVVVMIRAAAVRVEDDRRREFFKIFFERVGIVARGKI